MRYSYSSQEQSLSSKSDRCILNPSWLIPSSYRQDNHTCLVNDVDIIAAKQSYTGASELMSTVLIHLVGCLAHFVVSSLVVIVLSRVLRVGKCKAWGEILQGCIAR